MTPQDNRRLTRVGPGTPTERMVYQREDDGDPMGVVRDPAKNQCISFDATMNFAEGKKGAPEMISA